MIKSISNSVILMIKNDLPQVADQPHLPSLMINEKDFSTQNLSNKTIQSLFTNYLYSLQYHTNPAYHAVDQSMLIKICNNYLK